MNFNLYVNLIIASEVVLSASRLWEWGDFCRAIWPGFQKIVQFSMASKDTF